ncbi:hypothetical protein TraAM80_04970 [Trypanosoma rangeli]|uniref:Uncharacterized protein n=1 Tax=Trypanosoma rangeli TaxID=5698 RepID=A0A3R7LWQ7_TRYRA|nr:uncharacterized protein TraAM80_04970 [Trypanosoma rangeli]RNF04838.1 hypothetical protein TraAM80_04970 [Trypanosoma rangeli]|eukprot:RNF04838.1 hypothetical protein TraAM80_04970 [Trypanosoma rangeli]
MAVAGDGHHSQHLRAMWLRALSVGWYGVGPECWRLDDTVYATPRAGVISGERREGQISRSEPCPSLRSSIDTAIDYAAGGGGNDCPDISVNVFPLVWCWFNDYRLCSASGQTHLVVPVAWLPPTL